MIQCVTWIYTGLPRGLSMFRFQCISGAKKLNVSRFNRCEKIIRTHVSNTACIQVFI